MLKASVPLMVFVSVIRVDCAIINCSNNHYRTLKLNEGPDVLEHGCPLTLRPGRAYSFEFCMYDYYKPHIRMSFGHDSIMDLTGTERNCLCIARNYTIPEDGVILRLEAYDTCPRQYSYFCTIKACVKGAEGSATLSIEGGDKMPVEWSCPSLSRAHDHSSASFCAHNLSKPMELKVKKNSQTVITTSADCSSFTIQKNEGPNVYTFSFDDRCYAGGKFECFSPNSFQVTSPMFAGSLSAVSIFNGGYVSDFSVNETTDTSIDESNSTSDTPEAVSTYLPFTSVAEMHYTTSAHLPTLKPFTRINFAVTNLVLLPITVMLLTYCVILALKCKDKYCVKKDVVVVQENSSLPTDCEFLF